MTALATKQPDAGFKSPWTIAFVAIAMVLNSANAGEPSDLDSAARQFRIRAYDRYRMNRVEYDRQIDKAEQLLRRLKRGEISRTDAIHWLRGDIRISQQVVRPSQTRAHLQSTEPIEVRPPTIPGRTPSSLASRPYELESSTHTIPPKTTERSSAHVSTRHISINLDVLSARIESCNLELETIEAQLHPDARPLFPDELSALADELENAINQQEFSRSYIGVLSDDEQARIPRLASVEPIVASFSRRLFDAQIRAHRQKSGAGTVDDDVKTLRDLARRIRKWQNR